MFRNALIRSIHLVAMIGLLCSCASKPKEEAHEGTEVSLTGRNSATINFDDRDEGKPLHFKCILSSIFDVDHIENAKDRHLMRKLESAISKSDYRDIIELADSNYLPAIRYLVSFGRIPPSLLSAEEKEKFSRQAANHSAATHWDFFNYAMRYSKEKQKFLRLASRSPKCSFAAQELAFMLSNEEPLSEEAAALFISAAKDGPSYAKAHVADLYEYGIGVQIDLNEAVKWRRDAADSGHFESRIILSGDLLDGIKVERNASEAISLLDRVVDAHILLLHRMSYKYSDGDGVDQDPRKAREFEKLAREAESYKRKVVMSSLLLEAIEDYGRQDSERSGLYIGNRKHDIRVKYEADDVEGSE